MSIENTIKRNVIKDSEKTICPKCNGKQWTRFVVSSLGIDQIVKCMCRCENEQYELREAQQKENQRLMRLKEAEKTERKKM